MKSGGGAAKAHAKALAKKCAHCGKPIWKLVHEKCHDGKREEKENAKSAGSPGGITNAQHKKGDFNSHTKTYKSGKLPWWMFS